MILLTDEEKDKIVDAMPEKGEEKTMAIENTLLKAQLKKYVEWSEERCTEHPNFVEVPGETYYFKHPDCWQCWQALLKELGDDRQEELVPA